MPLTDLKVQSIKAGNQPLKLTDGDGLYLHIAVSGTKTWRFDYRYNNKRYTLTIGKYPLVSLAEARIKRSEAKKKLLDGNDPSAAKREQKETVRAATEDNFKNIGNAWYESKASTRSQAWCDANKLYLERDLYPTLGKYGVKEINSRMLLDLLEKCAEERGIKTADRVRGTAFQVFQYAVFKMKIDGNPAARLKQWAELPEVIHRPHLQQHEISELVETIDAYVGLVTTKLAAKLLLLTFVRKTELLEAEWTEFDLENAKWIIPAERMKMKGAHIVPLSKQAVETLHELKTITSGSKYVFPSLSTTQKPLSRTALNRMFSNMGKGKYQGKFSPHGIRATASTWLNESGYRHDAIERQLAHTERNRVRASYNHADYYAERKTMMQAWADICFPSE
jgi:integrase